MMIERPFLIFFSVSLLLGSIFVSSSMASQLNEGSFVFSNGAEVFYYYENGDIIEMFLDHEINSLIIKAESNEDGSIDLLIPRSILDSKSATSDDVFFVFVNGEEVSFYEEKDSVFRSLEISMLGGYTEIEIFGTQTLDSSEYALNTASIMYYVYPLPDWADYAKNVVDNAISAWEDTNPDLDFIEVSSPEQANFAIAWVKDFGGLHVGIALGTEYMEVGLGDSFCDGTWRPFHPDHITYIAEHEIGHILGFEHTSDPNDLMYREVPPVQYNLENYEFDSTAGYIHFLPVCSGLDLTSYNYTIETDDPNGIDVYFVPSIKEYDNFEISETFEYYSDSGCFAENVVKFSGNCSGVSGLSGLLVSLPDKTNQGLVRITASLFETVGSDLVSQQKSQEQTGSYFDSASGFVGSANVTTDKTSYEYGETISISGKLSEPKRGAHVSVSITDPLGNIVSQSRHVTTSYGDFNTVTSIPIFHPEGDYTVSTYNERGIFLGDGRFTVGTQIIQNDFVQQFPGIEKIEDLNMYENDEFGFSIQYPQDWIVDDSYVEPITQPGIFDIAYYPVRFYNDIDAWQVYFEVKYVMNDNTAKSFTGSQYLDKLTNILREDCKISSFDYEGFTCSNHSIIDSKIIEIDEHTAYQVTDSSISTYPDGEYFRDTRVVTDIIVGNNVWTIDATSESSKYPKYANAIHSSINSFVIWAGGEKPTQVQDDAPPLILTPSDIVVDPDDQHGAIVDFSVKAIDNQEGLVGVFCTPSPSSYFQIGTTKVLCNSQDSSLNLAEKSFTVTVGGKSIVIPEWIKNVAGFWCNDEIDDSSFVEGIRYLINNNVIIISQTPGSGGSDEIPPWIKNNACWWTENRLSDEYFAEGLKYLIENSIPEG